jgi:spore maturation protein CgeB
MKILYAAMQYDYGIPENGESFEETNFKSALVGMGHEVLHFDFMERKRLVGESAMREEFIAFAAASDFDLVFLFLFTNELDPRTLESLRSVTRALIINWFADDHWRFDGFTSRYAKLLDWSITTDADSLIKYAQHGISNVILSQWACNKYVYHAGAAPAVYEYDVSFVGQPHGNRMETISSLSSRHNIDVACFGRGWPNGRVSTEQMIATFYASKVNLNLANSSRPPLHEVIARRLLRLGGSFGERPPQIKGRTFEIPGCAGFQLTEYVPHLENYFVLDKEIAVYREPSELGDKILYWLEHPEEREEVARAGHERVMREHTYDCRFTEIFDAIGVR